ncbi:MAG: hypothetical protein E7562_06665 [Ruminococcaceae bacterium]|nr:hypothetical protein [Oscillospiraceae bacterium]
MEKENLKLGLKMFGSLCVVTVLCVFIAMSFLVLCSSFFTDEIGYNAVIYDKDGKEIENYTYYYDDGEDAILKKYSEDEGYKINKQTVRSQISKTGDTVFALVTQLFSTMILIGFIYPSMWHLGAKDSNLVRFKHRKSDMLRGLKIGLIAKIPALIILILFLVFGKTLTVVLYSFINSSNFGFIDMICGGGSTPFAQLGVLQIIGLFALLLIAPAVSTVGYLLGVKDISLSEKFIYSGKKKRKY